MSNIRKNVSLAPLTTFHIGGKADYFVEVSGTLELAEALEYADDHHLTTCVFSGGSNVIFPDAGFRGMVIRIVDGGIHISQHTLSAGAGVKLSDVVQAACAAGLSGIERLAGIPGSFGGAIRGNAGAFGAEIGDVVSSVKGFLRETGMVKEYKQDACLFGYRTSIFKQHPKILILSADIKLSLGDKESLQWIMAETLATRESKHPQDIKCAGSFFMNPLVRDTTLREEFQKDTGTESKDDKLPAGWLIDHAGLRGKKIGGAMVSDRHPNYLINTGNATAEDVMMLASLVKTRVRDELRVKLEEEVQYIGF
ncbi:MAG: UDP-N-acetylmuramate dehydrogenase [Candidatus Moranbacteria bacterium]|nr:UDP-N-acetylmuramate dehydrogenase [Candidatus Moranbacteria bacterium]